MQQKSKQGESVRSSSVDSLGVVFSVLPEMLSKKPIKGGGGLSVCALAISSLAQQHLDCTTKNLRTPPVMANMK